MCMGLDNKDSPLLGDALLLSLLVESAPGLGPQQLSRLLLLVNEALALGGGKSDDLDKEYNTHTIRITTKGVIYTKGGAPVHLF